MLTVLTGFGGGIMAPMMVGKPPLIFQNELIIPFCVLFWYLCNTNVGFQAIGFQAMDFQKLLTSTPAKLAWGVFNGLFRTHTVCNMVKVATETLPVGPYYTHPLMGPIIAGTILGGGSNFMPLNKGLAPIDNATPWTLQGAFMTAVFFYFQVCDKTGWLGSSFRAVFGSHSEADVRAIIATVHIATILTQVIFDESANFFTPIHKFLYIVFHVNGPTRANQFTETPAKTIGWAWQTRITLERCLEVGRVLIVVGVVITHIFLLYPSSALVPGLRLSPGNHIAICQGSVFGLSRSCEPSSFSFLETAQGFKLVAYKGKPSTEVDAQSVTWKTDVYAKLASDEKASAVIGVDGRLRVVAENTGSQSERELWVSKSSCKAPTSSTSKFSKGSMTLEEASGTPIVLCPGGERVKLA